MATLAQIFPVCFSVSLPSRQSYCDNKYGFFPPTGSVLVWLPVSLPVCCLSAVCGWFLENSALTVRCFSVVSSSDGSGVCGSCPRVWGGGVAAGLHRQLLYGVCNLLHFFTLLWNREITESLDICRFALTDFRFKLYNIQSLLPDTSWWWTVSITPCTKSLVGVLEAQRHGCPTQQLYKNLSGVWICFVLLGGGGSPLCSLQS